MPQASLRAGRRCKVAPLLLLTILVPTVAGRAFAQYAQYYEPSYGWGSSPNGDYMRGAALVIRAQGQFMIDKQHAELLKEQVQSAKIDNRRKKLEQWLWERENLPTAQDERERVQKEVLRYSRNDPSITHIWSGSALNSLLLDLQKASASNGAAPSPPLSADVLMHINLTTAQKGANTGLLKSGKLFWPLLLRRERFGSDRHAVDDLVTEVVNDATTGRMNADGIERLMQRLEAMHRELSVFIHESNGYWTSSMYVDAKSFLHQLEDAVRALQQPDAASYFNGKYAAKGESVADLVRYMTERGLVFAPAVPGDEASYKALHRAMAAYSSAIGEPVKTHNGGADR